MVDGQAGLDTEAVLAVVGVVLRLRQGLVIIRHRWDLALHAVDHRPRHNHATPTLVQVCSSIGRVYQIIFQVNILSKSDLVYRSLSLYVSPEIPGDDFNLYI